MESLYRVGFSFFRPSFFLGPPLQPHGHIFDFLTSLPLHADHMIVGWHLIVFLTFPFPSSFRIDVNRIALPLFFPLMRSPSNLSLKCAQ